VKIPRVPEAAKGLEREAAVLGFLDARGGLAGAPKAFWIGPFGPLPAMAQSALPGRSVLASLRATDARDLAVQVTDWLVMLAQRTARPDDGGRWSRLAVPALASMGEQLASLGMSPPGAGTPLTAASLEGLPLVVEHRDCAPWNLVRGSAGDLRVLDWESAEIDGLPGLDLLYFLAYLAFALEQVPFHVASTDLRAAYRRSLDPTSPTGAIRAECLGRYARALGIVPERLAALAPLAWAIHFASEYRNFAADAGPTPLRDRLRQSVFLTLLDEDARKQAVG
jgi:hypothetical protein